MPEIVACPDCGRKLRVPDELLGKKVKCPGCGVNFSAKVAGSASAAVSTTPAAPPPRREDYDPPREGESRSVSPTRTVKTAWKRVRSGIGFVLISIWVFLGSFALTLFGSMLLGASGTASTGVLMSFRVLVLLTQLASIGLYVTGQAFCMGAPPNKRYSVRGMGMSAFILSASYAGLFLLGNIIQLVGAADAADALASSNPMSMLANAKSSAQTMSVGMIVMLMADLTGFAAFIVFALFLRSVCLAVKRDDQASTIVTFLLSMAGTVFVSVVVFVLIGALAGLQVFSAATSGSVGAATNSMQAAGAILFVGCSLCCVLGIVELGLSIWYIILLFQVKAAVDLYIRRL